MAIEGNTPRSRRALLAGIGGAFVALAAQAVGRPVPVLAEGETMHVGGDYLNATSATQLKNTTTDNDLFIATSTRAGRGVYGKSAGSVGVQGRTDGAFVGRGVLGISGVATAPAIRAENEATGAVASLANGSIGLFTDGGTDGEGVRAISGTGRGVLGNSTQGSGVEGWTGWGVGVRAEAFRDGTAVEAVADERDAFALVVRGRASLSRSGIAIIPAGGDRIALLIQGLSPSSFALATLQQFRGGVFVASTAVKPAQARIVIRLNRTVSAATKVAYQVLEAA